MECAHAGATVSALNETNKHLSVLRVREGLSQARQHLLIPSFAEPLPVPDHLAHQLCCQVVGVEDGTPVVVPPRADDGCQHVTLARAGGGGHHVNHGLNWHRHQAEQKPWNPVVFGGAQRRQEPQDASLIRKGDRSRLLHEERHVIHEQQRSRLLLPVGAARPPLPVDAGDAEQDILLAPHDGEVLISIGGGTAAGPDELAQACQGSLALVLRGNQRNGAAAQDAAAGRVLARGQGNAGPQTLLRGGEVLGRGIGGRCDS